MQSLRETRLSQKRSLQYVATATGKTLANLSQIERGIQNPEPGTRKALNKYFKAKINYLDVPVIRFNSIRLTHWNTVEKRFRDLYKAVYGLPEDEQVIFIDTAIKHLKSIRRKKNE